MTILSRSAVDRGLVTAQCDVCFPQHIATTTLTHLQGRGWLLRDLGDEMDMCPHCRYEPQQGHEPRATRARRHDGGGGQLPTFFVIGAAKAGTTSLFHYLDQHPDLYLTPQKELHYFCDPDCRQWESLYREEFVTEAGVRGEASTLYTRSPAIPGVPGRMAALVPDARLVYLVRDPVERALASWREERFHVTERRSAAEAFAYPEDPHNPYVAASCYAQQLENYLEHFAEEQVLVLDQRELATDGQRVVDRVVDFLGLAPRALDTSVRHNEAASKLEYGAFGHRLRFTAPARAVRRLPEPARRVLTAPARRFLRRPIEHPELPDELMQRMRETLAADARRFRELTGRSFAHWSV